MRTRSRLGAAFLCLVLTAARPLPDLHKWDGYFALFAPDSSVPWKNASVRLDTYSGAPVDFAVYPADPRDVIVAGTAARPRVLDTRRLRAIARWRFSPPPGYRFDSNSVNVPIGSREGFFVVEARRGGVAEQVWIDRTRIGFLAKESASELLFYVADLGTGRALAHARVNLLSGGRFDTRFTDDRGVLRIRDRTRPVFALADYANSNAFVSLLPQAPAAPSVAGIVLDSAVVRAGTDVRVAGFARARSGAAFKPSAGEAEVSLRSGARVLAQQRVRLDRAGAFATALHVADNVPQGDYSVLLQVGNASAGTTLHVDANAGGTALEFGTPCRVMCPPSDAVPFTVRATRGGADAPGTRVHVEVVRSPHVFGENAPNRPWGVTTVLSQDVITGPDGIAHVSIAPPSDGLASTYGIRASAGNASAATRLVVPTAAAALDLQVDRTQQSVGNAVSFDVRAAYVADNRPVAHVPVRVRLIHGSSAQEQTVTLDAGGRARGSFSAPQLGSNLVLARATIDGQDALDAQEVQIDPGVGDVESASRSSDVRIAFDRASYRAGERVGVDAQSAGTSGDALLTYETPGGFDAAVVPVRGGAAHAQFAARNAAGSIAVGAAFVHDGTLRWNVAPLALSGAGRPQLASVHVDRSVFAPGETVALKIDEGASADRTVIVRMTSGMPSGAARFVDTPDLLAIGQPASQDTAPPQPSWHAWIDASRARDESFAFDQRTPVNRDDVSVADAQTQTVYWNVIRTGSALAPIVLPRSPGDYTLSILELGDDGHVAAAAQSLTVR